MLMIVDSRWMIDYWQRQSHHWFLIRDWSLAIGIIDS
jgi:hypothetical protein